MLIYIFVFFFLLLGTLLCIYTALAGVGYFQTLRRSESRARQPLSRVETNAADTGIAQPY